MLHQPSWDTPKSPRMSAGPRRRRVGIVGFGHLGQYLVQRLQDDGLQLGLELAFVWNRDSRKLQGQVPSMLQLLDLAGVPQRAVDLVIEVAHPCIAQEHGEAFLAHADFMVGSPTALADHATETRLREAARRGGHTLYVPRGALWGGEDIQRMDDRGMLQGLKVTMLKHPDSFRLQGELQVRLQGAQAMRTVLYQGPVRELCPLAPNNVNTMAAACMAAPSLGFDQVQGCLIADPSLPDCHVVEVEVTGLTSGPGDQAFTVTSSRRNPAFPGAVTGSATFVAFWSSLLACQGHGGCIHLC
ncbi:aspartate dehydrogenase domain-containing protein [Alligator mississippiensis]|uniref:Aspartate dehydrogenase domain-containing protein n=1 Tax=Alligator mississippiensis TaxID=8496 RepID=A0A151NTI5_ALLMI|nr:aspartate dehydrogenase domain-containing protein [Alligator mississippiensis]KYO39899.1 putative L-aspartate dehydrogenase [Alligator mississippiensis]